MPNTSNQSSREYELGSCSKKRTLSVVIEIFFIVYFFGLINFVLKSLLKSLRQQDFLFFVVPALLTDSWGSRGPSANTIDPIVYDMAFFFELVEHLH